MRTRMHSRTSIVNRTARSFMSASLLLGAVGIGCVDELPPDSTSKGGMGGSDTSNTSTSSTSGAGSSSSGMGGGSAGSGGNGGDGGSLPLSLDITDVNTQIYANCVEPKVQEVQETIHDEDIVPADPVYFVPGTIQQTPVPQFTYQSTCTATVEGLECDAATGYNVTLNIPAQSADRLAFEVFSEAGGTLIVAGANTGSTVIPPGMAVPFEWIYGLSAMARTATFRFTSSTAGAKLIIRNLRRGHAFAKVNATIPATQKTTWRVPQPFTDADKTNVFGPVGRPYIQTFRVESLASFGYYCSAPSADGLNCNATNPGCMLYAPGNGVKLLQGANPIDNWESLDPTNLKPEPYMTAIDLTQLLSSGIPTWEFAEAFDASTLPDPTRVQRISRVVLYPGVTYGLACNDAQQASRMFIRTFTPKLHRNCHYLNWYFDLREGDKPATTLTTNDIVATVDGVNLGVESNAALTQQNTLRVALLLDRSYSITEAGAAQSVRDAAKSFVNAMPEGTFFQARKFASEPSVPLFMQGSTWDKAKVLSAIDTNYDPWPISNAEGFTKLFDAMGRTGFLMQDNNGTVADYPYFQRVLVVLTDGEDTASTVFVDGQGLPNASLVREQLDVCRVHTIAVGLGSSIQQSTLASLSDRTVIATTKEDLADSFAKVAEDLKGRFRLRQGTPAPVYISNTSSLEISLGGQSVIGTYTPPTLPCQQIGN